MKKLISLTFVLLFALSLTPLNMEAKMAIGKTVKGHEASDGFCDAGGSGCTYEELDPVEL